MTPEEFVRMWGSENLVTWPTDVLEKLPSSNETKAFLHNAGLPAETTLEWRFGTTVTLPSVCTFLKSESIADDYLRFKVIGSVGIGATERAWVCLDTANPDDVVQVATSAGSASWCFVNSGVPQLAECVFAVRMIYESDDSKNLHVLADELEQYIRGVDPAALTTADAFWPLTIEEARSGM